MYYEHKEIKSFVLTPDLWGKARKEERKKKRNNFTKIISESDFLTKKEKLTKLLYSLFTKWQIEELGVMA